MVGGPFGRFVGVDGGFMIDLGDDGGLSEDLYGMVTDRRFWLWLWFHGPMSITGEEFPALGTVVPWFSSDPGGLESILVSTTASNPGIGLCFVLFDDLPEGLSSM
jgi:hypothetical protein